MHDIYICTEQVLRPQAVVMSYRLSRQHDVGGATVQRHGWCFSVALRMCRTKAGGRGGSAPSRAGMQGAFAEQRPLPPAARSRANERDHGASRQKEPRTEQLLNAMDLAYPLVAMQLLFC